jgi:hypothetical protein
MCEAIEKFYPKYGSDYALLIVLASKAQRAGTELARRHCNLGFKKVFEIDEELLKETLIKTASDTIVTNSFTIAKLETVHKKQTMHIFDNFILACVADGYIISLDTTAKIIEGAA